MADQVITKQELIDAQKDAQTLEDAVNGEPGKLIKSRTGREFYSLASVPQINTMTREEVNAAVALKANQADVDASITAIAGGHKAYTTLALAQAAQSSLPANTVVEVTNDLTSTNNGTYQWDGTTLTKSAYDPLTQSKSYVDSKKFPVGNMDFIKPTKNLFIKELAEIGKYVGDDGFVGSSAAYFVSDYIPVTPNTQYYGKGVNGKGFRFVCVYNTLKTVVGSAGVNDSNSDTNAFTTPSNGYFVRITSLVDLVDSFQFELGSVGTEYIKGGYILQHPDGASIKAPLNVGEVKEVNLDNVIVSPSKTTFLTQTKNIFNKAAAATGKFIDSASGVLMDNASYASSDFIPVTVGSSYWGQGINGMRTIVFYNSSKARVSGINSTDKQKNFTVPSGASYVRVTVDLADLSAFQLEVGSSKTDYISYGYLLKNNDGTPIILPDSTPVPPVSSASVSFTYGEWYLRETRQRTRKLLLNEDKQFTIAAIGDSWTHNRDRWSGVVARELISEFGDAGGGWTGFGFGSASLPNDNARSEYSVTRSSGWSSTYGSSVSPDICHATSNTAGNSITCTTPSNPDLSGCDLYFIGSSTASIRYKFNSGDWTALALNSVADGELGITALTGFGSGANTLVIEVVSGTCSLCGVNWKSTANGVVFHKLGATGTRAKQWAEVNEVQWKKGLQALNPNLVTIMHGTNDQAAYLSSTVFAPNISTIIDRVRSALPLADILVVMPCENGSAAAASISMASYTAKVYDVCVAKKVAFMDLQKVFGETFSEYSSTSERNWFNADLIHPEPSTGGRAITDAILRFLLG